MAESEKKQTPLEPRSGVASSAHSSFMSDDWNFSSSDSEDDDFDWEGDAKMEMRKANSLSRRLLAVDDDDHLEQDRILRKSLKLHHPLEPSVGSDHGFFDDTMDQQQQGGMMMYIPMQIKKSSSIGRFSFRNSGRFRNMFEDALTEAEEKARRRIFAMLGMAVSCVIIMVVLAYVGIRSSKPPMQPVGPYVLLERQEGTDFFKYYNFYEGPDSVGSNGYNNYVSQATARTLGIVNVTYEDDELDVIGRRHLKETDLPAEVAGRTSPISEPFVYMGSAATPDGPRESIRLEGIRRFDRGLFIIDIRHMPAGCGVWPAFWLTDEANWPVNGEIDIVEGVNYQTHAKTALHSTQGCDMFDIPLGTMTGGWDTAQGIPNADTGIPDMTMRYARNCFVYDQHQWLNQGCVAVDLDGGTIGQPLNDKGGGVYALEWDPINRHIRSWVFTPHESMPQNLVEAIRTAHLPPNERTAPNPQEWRVGTNCPDNHFQRMRLVFNTAFCGSVAGNRFQLDCPKQAKQFSTCNEWVKSNPAEMDEAFWKIRGVYVYQRDWEAKMLK
eukprot:scaffold568_cov160-Amphora_coffeaeformis.AAC.17